MGQELYAHVGCRPEIASRFDCDICRCESWNEPLRSLDDSVTEILTLPSDFDTVTY